MSSLNLFWALHWAILGSCLLIIVGLGALFIVSYRLVNRMGRIEHGYANVRHQMRLLIGIQDEEQQGRSR